MSLDIFNAKLSEVPQERDLPEGRYVFRFVSAKADKYEDVPYLDFTLKPVEPLDDQDMTDVSMRPISVRNRFNDGLLGVGARKAKQQLLTINELPDNADVSFNDAVDMAIGRDFVGELTYWQKDEGSRKYPQLKGVRRYDGSPI